MTDISIAARELEEYIKEYDYILIRNKVNQSFMNLIDKRAEVVEKKVLILTTDNVKANNSFVCKVSMDKYEDYVELYRIYEFSDKIILLDEDIPCGIIINYIKTGLLSEWEAVCAIIR